MSVYPNVTEEDLINLSKLAEQQEEQRAIKIKNKIINQTHDEKLTKNLSPITKKLNTINESTQKISEVVNESNSKDNVKALPNSSEFSVSMPQMLGSLMHSRNSLKITQDESG